MIPYLSHKGGGLLILKVLIFLIIFYTGLLNVVQVQKDGGYLNMQAKFVTANDRIKGRPFNAKAYSAKADFASEESGCRILASSQSLKYVSSILNSDRNSYMLAPCRRGGWFILSFPESISIEKIALISNEHYASRYKYISISASDVYPSSKWRTLAEIATSPSRNEIFDISQSCSKLENFGCWAKYLKVDLLDYHNVEDNYYCSLTGIKIYGATAVDVLENETEDEIKHKLNTGIDSTGETCPIHSESHVVEKEPVTIKRGVSKMTDSGDSSWLEQRYYHDVDKNTRNVCKRYAILWPKDSNVLITRLSPVRYSILRGKYKRRLRKSSSSTKLSANRRWLSTVINKFLLKLAAKSDLNYSNYFRTIPVLVCRINPGCMGVTNCFSHFTRASDLTLKSTRRMFTFMPTRRLQSKTFCFLYSDNGLYFNTPVYVGHGYKQYDGGFNVHYRILEGPAAYINVSLGSLTLSTFTETLKNTETNSMVSNLNNTILESHKSATIVSQAAEQFKPLLKIVHGALSGENFKGKHGNKHMNEKIFLNIFESLTRVTARKRDVGFTDQGIPKYKKNGGHKHVLLKLSERVKELEMFTNQLSTWVLDNRRTCEAHLVCSQQKVAKTEEIISLLHRDVHSLSRLVRQVSDAIGLQERYVIYRSLKHNRIKYIERRHVIDQNNPTSRRREKYMCHIYHAKPDTDNTRCARLYMTMRLSFYSSILSKWKMLECCSRFGCKCRRIGHGATSRFYIWMPHFECREKHANRFLNSLGATYIRRIRRVPFELAYFLSLFSGLLFNIYTLFILFLVSQLFWIYRDHCNQQTIQKYCFKTCKCEQVTKT